MKRQYFLLACTGIGVMILIAMLPPRAMKLTPTTGPNNQAFTIQHSPFSIPTVLPTDPIRGAPTAPLTIIEYGDFTCPSCVDAEGTLNVLRAEYGPRLRIIWKDFPALDRITGSRRVHLAARCAQQQGKFWEYHDAALNEQPRGDDALLELAVRLGLNAVPFTTCLTNEAPASLVDVYRSDASRLNLRAAPTFFVNGIRLDGHSTIDDFRALLRTPAP